MRMFAYFKPLVIVLIGLGIASTGVQMSLARQIHKFSTDTREQHAAIGMGVGVVSGVVLSLVIGGVGVVTGGTGFAIGLPVMAALGFGGGALAGAATGKLTTVQEVSMVYSPWAYVPVLAVGMCMTWYGMILFKRIRRGRAESVGVLHERHR